MGHYLYIDIETLPCVDPADAPPGKAPSNYKDPEKIAAYIAEHAAEAHRATALDPYAGRILAIGYALDDEDPQVLYGEDEQALLVGLETVIRRVDPHPYYLVGHNLEGFDLRWLYLRAARYRLPHLQRRLPWHPYQRAYRIDTMLLAGGPSRERVSLARLARYFGLGSKAEGLDGSAVYDAYLAGEHARIQRYCAADVELTRDIHDRLEGFTKYREDRT